MSPFETFNFCFVSTLAFALLVAGYRSAPTLIALYRITVYQWNQPIPSKYALDNLKFCVVNNPLIP